MACLCEELRPENTEWSPVCIGQLWVFDGLGQEEMLEVVQRALRRRYRMGQCVFRQGDPAREISLIKAGRIRLSKLLEDGTELTLDIRKPSDFLGEYIFSEEFTYPVTAWCMEETLVCSFTKEGFEQLVLQKPNIGLQIIKNLSNRISHLTDRLGAMSQTHLEDRLYRVLLNVAREHGEKKREGYVILFPLTHEDLGFLIGAHRVSITRVMKRLKESGKIRQMGRKLVLPVEAVS
jgi:CRP/FNR family transcriptional regulator